MSLDDGHPVGTRVTLACAPNRPGRVTGCRDRCGEWLHHVRFADMPQTYGDPEGPFTYPELQAIAPAPEAAQSHVSEQLDLFAEVARDGTS